jgi:putative resolvase
MYTSAKTLQSRYGVSSSSLRHWANTDRLDFRRTPGGKRLYNTDDIAKLFHDNEQPIKIRARVVYARVSSSKQRADLGRQVERLSQAYPQHEVVQDIGSGVNWERRGFKTILERAFSRDLEEVVVEHRDRLCRFGYTLLAFIFKKLDVRLLVHGHDEAASESHQQELAEDLLAIVNVFVAKNNGMRSAANKRKRQACEKAGEDESV